MPRVSSTVTVPLDPARAFALSQTYGELRYRWDPFVREQRLLDGAGAAGKGVRTWTRSRHRLTMVSEYVTYRPRDRRGTRRLTCAFGPVGVGLRCGSRERARRPSVPPLSEIGAQARRCRALPLPGGTEPDAATTKVIQ
jgi:hypothetical protein